MLQNVMMSIWKGRNVDAAINVKICWDKGEFWLCVLDRDVVVFK
jgi:hypothetical protein